MSISEAVKPKTFESTLARALQIGLIARQRTPLLWWAGWILIALSIPLLILSWLDHRLFNGISIWIKPWKFHVSVGVHFLTLAWFAALLPLSYQRRLRRLAIVVFISGLFEIIYITGRASLGLASHFDTSTAFTSAMYSLMGIGAVALTACAGLLGVWTMRAHDYLLGHVLQKGIAWGLVLGAILGTLTGGYLSGSMTGHWIGGTPSDLDGSWLFHWSRDGGDLRVAHFFGLHAMQVIPLFAWLTAYYWKPAIAQKSIVMLILFYPAIVVLTFAQAIAGRPFF